MRNQSYEQALNKNCIEWEYIEKLPLDQIDPAKSLRNQARLDTPVDEELIEAYRASDKDGFDFPPLVVWRPGKGKYILIDGNQRYAAYQKNNRTHTDVYYVKNTDPKVVYRITGTFNNMVNGKRISREEATEHAISYVRKFGVPTKEAAKEWGVSEGTLSNRIRQEDARALLQEHSIPITPNLTNDHIQVLQPLRDVGVDLFCAAAEAVGQTGATQNDVRELVREVRRAETVEGKMKKVDEFVHSEKMMERKAETKGGQIKQPRSGTPRDKFQRLLKELRNVMEDFDAKALSPGRMEWKTHREAALSVSRRLCIMFGLGNVPEDKTEVG